MDELPSIINILLCEDSVTDAQLTLEALRYGTVQNRIHHVRNGEEAMKYLRREPPYIDVERPDLILLDLNMPRMNGRGVLEAIRSDEDLKVIPIIILTTSTKDEDVIESYGLAANSYIVKPVELDKFFAIVQQVQEFWMDIVKRPAKEESRQ
ncbi:UNVERIFIED_CONTAM: hypothetical protein GTU68_038983 [Idotea baltica]|nr:hypothetical protein [Idotea baltica]